MRENHYDYVVSLSYAHEDSKFVTRVARHLEAEGLGIYFDKDDQINSWGKNLIEHLDAIYSKESKFCVVFLSRHYKRKAWTQFEHSVIQGWIMKGGKGQVLPFRLDNTEIPGWPDTITYLSIKEYGSKRLADAIIKKINEGPDTSPPPIGWRELLRRVFSKRVKNTLAAFLLVIATLIVFTDRLTLVDRLANRLYDASRKDTKYIMCRDGAITFNLQSNCSHHSGIDTTRDTVLYLKTPQQCRQEAKQISWLAFLAR
jgi:hypothetical protein